MNRDAERRHRPPAGTRAARGLIVADRIRSDSRFKQLRDGRYTSFDSGPGQAFEKGELTLTDLRNHAAENGEPELISGKQELLENLLNDHLFA